jgi:hypothetical protein
MPGRKKGWKPALAACYTCVTDASRVARFRALPFAGVTIQRTKGKQLKAASHRKVKAKARRPSRKPVARTAKHAKHAKHAKTRSRSHAKAKPARRTAVSRARAGTPARSTHGAAVAPARRVPIPSPLPTKHVAAVRVAVTLPARSMPPGRDHRKSLVTVAQKPVAAQPEFAEAGVLLAITYSIREGRRGEFFDLMRELKPLLHTIGGGDVAIYEDRSRPNYLMEVFRFKDEVEFTAFDDKFHKDRKIAAIYALLDDIVEAEKSDFKIFERRL